MVIPVGHHVRDRHQHVGRYVELVRRAQKRSLHRAWRLRLEHAHDRLHVMEVHIPGDPVARGMAC